MGTPADPFGPTEVVSTSDPNAMASAQHFLVYLNVHTHTSGEATAVLHKEIKERLALKMHFILVHETRPEHGGCTFKEIIDATPPELKVRPGGMYDELAVELCGGAHMHVSLRLLLAALEGRSGPKRRGHLAILAEGGAGEPTTKRAPLSPVPTPASTSCASTRSSPMPGAWSSGASASTSGSPAAGHEHEHDTEHDVHEALWPELSVKDAQHSVQKCV